MESQCAQRNADGELGSPSVGSDERERQQICERRGEYDNDRAQEEQHRLSKISDERILVEGGTSICDTNPTESAIRMHSACWTRR